MSTQVTSGFVSRARVGETERTTEFVRKRGGVSLECRGTLLEIPPVYQIIIDPPARDCYIGAQTGDINHAIGVPCSV